MINWAFLLTTLLTGTTALSAGEASAAAVALRCPSGLALAGNHLYFSESGGHRVRRLDLVTGVVTLVAGTGARGFSGDGGPAAAAQLSGPMGLALTPDGALVVADVGNQRLRRVDLQRGIITTLAGRGEKGFGGDGGPARDALLNGPYDVAVDGAGHLLIADTNNDRIRRVDGATGVITTAAGTGTRDFGGDGGAATAAQLRRPHVVAVDAHGALLIGDSFNLRIRRVDTTTGVINTIAGTGEIASAGDGGPAREARFAFFGAIRADGGGNLYITEFGANRVRRIDAETGTVTTVAGDGVERLAGDGGQAAQASLASPLGLAIDRAGNLFIADCGNDRIRRVDAESGVINTLIGDPSQPSHSSP